MTEGVITGISPKFILIVHVEQPGVPSECLIYSWPVLKWMRICWWNVSWIMIRLLLILEKMYKAFICNSYINKRTCGSLENTIRSKYITHIGYWTYPCYWLGLKRGFCTTKFRYQQYIYCWPKLKNMWMCCSCSFGTLLYK